MTVETMFSHAYLYRFHGTNEFADIAERAAFNALPAGVTADCEITPFLSGDKTDGNEGGDTATSLRPTNLGPPSLRPRTTRGTTLETTALYMAWSQTM